ncbi:uncharacterized protein Triagg1_8357 [Trichoderma aggressivum f. europaeum]|uniref:Uncharacterized protein n=1 Tax=Trichoderma aggressivum f. europaeum TaxID=173218 RepID=A0AAE1M213_9HYPO|nr:hypothetical protein Triagg1_8357 [Trichoderma aggressivum f. europaeum]
MGSAAYHDFNPDGCGVDDVPRFSLSHSPESLKTATTPGTPDDIQSEFGDAISAAQSSSASASASAARATSALRVFTHRPNDSTSSINDFAAAANGPKPMLGVDVSRFGSNLGIGNRAAAAAAAQIWAPPSVPLDHAAAERQNAAHFRWGSLDAHRSLVAGHGHENPLSRLPPFLASQHQLPAIVDSPVSVSHSRPYSAETVASARPYSSETVASERPFPRQPFTQPNVNVLRQYHHDGQGLPVSRYIPPSSKSNSSFDLSELQGVLLSSTAASEIDDSQPLGIDILRLSPPRTDPIRQPIPPPSTVQVPPVVNITVHPHEQPHGFLPMQAVMQQTPPGAFTHEACTDAFGSSKFSTRYHGMHTETNASAEHLAPEQNCALWLTNLPPGVSTHELLTAIRNVGRVWCSYVNYPDYVTHQTAAAKVVFFTPEAAQSLLSVSWTRGLYIQGYRVKVSHNRIKYGSHAITGKMSRCLIVTGHADFVNEASLSKFFKDRFIFQVDEVVELIKAGGRAVVEFKFGSYRCQSQMGKMSLEKDRPAGLEKVEFGDDPCEVGDTMSAYGIAAERIQGRGL